MHGAAYFKSGLGNFVNAIPAFMTFADHCDKGTIDFVLDADWIHDPRVPAIKLMAENSYYIDKIKYWPNIDLDQYDKFFIPVQCELSKCAREMMRRNKEKGLVKNYKWPNALWAECKLHEVDVNLKNLKSLGCECGGGGTPIFIPMAERAAVARYVPPKTFRSSLLFGVCNGAFQAKFWEKKKWPYFQDLCFRLKKYFKGCSIIGIGGPEELNGCDLNADATGKTDIMQTNRIINELDYFITTDTGCMHIADALKKKGLALFGPTLISKNGPIYGTMHAVKLNLECSPCQEGENFYTCNSYACMDLLGPDKIIDRIIKDF